MAKSKEHNFIVIWCSDGLEWVEDITDLDQRAMWATLKGETAKAISDSLRAMIFRARLNSQRCYEIYSVTASEGITKNNIIELFKTNPQGIADLIREKGYQIYSGRETTEKVIS